MTLLQLGIGTVNDIVDAPRDAGRKAGKPIPAGLVPSSAARFATGVILATTVSIPTGLLAVVVIAIGLAYDLGLKGTPWSWLPFAVGIPILPVFGWIGVTGTLHPAFLVLLPAAVAAGAALAIGNALVDVERDRAASVSSIAVSLGPVRSWRLTAALLASILAAAVGSTAVAGGGWVAIAAIAIIGTIPVLAAIGSRAASSAARERAWQAETLGLALLAAVWLATVVATGRPVG
jgi:geranylgeranylglycerol-phosphate geranylgeranyltransferase